MAGSPLTLLELVNKANPYDVDWQKDFYGANYPTLLKLKKKWDTRGLFYAKSGVGSEFWEELPNGRLCMRQ